MGLSASRYYALKTVSVTVQNQKYYKEIKVKWMATTALLYSEEKVKSVQTLCAIILLDSLNIDKTLINMKFIEFPINVNIFNKTL